MAFELARTIHENSRRNRCQRSNIDADTTSQRVPCTTVPAGIVDLSSRKG
jgi:hypothetical protein